MVQSLLIHFVILSERIFQTWGQLTLKPYGPKMCDMFCQRTENCSENIFDPIELTCQLKVYATTSTNTEEVTDLQPCAGITTGEDLGPGGLMTNAQRDAMKCPTENNDDNDFLGLCLQGNLEMVKRLLCQGLVDVNCKSPSEETCVMRAASSGNKEMFDFLVQHGCDLTAVDEDNSTVLHHACTGGSIDIVRNLVDYYNCSIHWRDNEGYTPLFFASEIPLLEFLKDRGADFKSRDDCSNTILHCACAVGDVNVVTYIISLELINLELKGEDGKTPLMIAVENNERDIADILHTQNNASLTSLDNFGNNLFHIACLRGHLDMVKHLATLKELRGFERKTNRSGNTPVQLAIKERHDEIVNFLKSLTH